MTEDRISKTKIYNRIMHRMDWDKIPARDLYKLASDDKLSIASAVADLRAIVETLPKRWNEVPDDFHSFHFLQKLKTSVRVIERFENVALRYAPADKTLTQSVVFDWLCKYIAWRIAFRLSIGRANVTPDMIKVVIDVVMNHKHYETLVNKINIYYVTEKYPDKPEHEHIARENASNWFGSFFWSYLVDVIEDQLTLMVEIRRQHNRLAKAERKRKAQAERDMADLQAIEGGAPSEAKSDE